ncbi:MAG TPA: hypothetical protein VK661_08400 [Planctomycetota bacterium]|nr:hypothetical protein [Planctomycetota bacterium]
MIHGLLILLSLLQEPVGEKVTLEARPKEGDKLAVVESWDNTFAGKLGDDPLFLRSRGGRRIQVEVAGVQGSRITRKVVQVEDSYREDQDVQTSKFVRQEDGLKGRKVTITLRDGKEERTGLDGVPDEAQKTLTLDDPLTGLFPTGPVRVGDSWEIAGDGLKKIFAGGDFTEGKITVRLREVKEVDGRKCAVLGTVWEVRGKNPDGFTRELRQTGTITVWIERGYVMGMDQKGVLKTTGAVAGSGMPTGESAITGSRQVTIGGK